MTSSDPDNDDAASTGTPPPSTPWGQGLRLLCVSVRGSHGYLIGNPNAHPIDLDPAAMPAGVGTRFADLDQIKHYVATELRGLSIIWQVRVIDDDGTVLQYGFRSGRGGTGARWIWQPPAPPAPESAATSTTTDL